jgi:hypothetical protein
VKTINVRILVRNNLDTEVALDQLLRGVIKLHGVVELTGGGEVWSPVVKRPNVAWSGEELTSE